MTSVSGQSSVKVHTLQCWSFHDRTQNVWDEGVMGQKVISNQKQGNEPICSTAFLL